MTIRNSVTGETRTIDPTQADQYGIQQPAVGNGVQGNALMGAANFMYPGLTKTITQGPQQLSDYDASLPNSQGNFGQSVINAAKDTGQLAKTVFTPQNLLELATTALGMKGAKAAVDVVPTAAKFALHPANTVGKALETEATKAGPAAQSLIEKYLGTADNPHPDLLKKAGMNLTQAKQNAGELINDLYRNNATGDLQGFGQPASTPSFLDLLNRRTNAYASAAKNFWQTSSPEQNLAKNFGRAYTNILHEGVPATKKLDLILSKLHMVNSPWAKEGLGAYAGYKLLQGGGNFLKGLFDQGN